MTRSLVLVAGVALGVCALTLGLLSEPRLLNALLRGAASVWRWCL